MIVHVMHSKHIDSLTLTSHTYIHTPLLSLSLPHTRRLQEDPPAGVSGAPTDNNIMLWNAVIFGYAVLMY